MELKFQVQTRILKPVAEVFDGVANPGKLTGYFTKTATPMEEGKTAFWSFPEFPEEFPVLIRKIVPEELIGLEWKADDGDYNTTIEIRFEDLGDGSTLVTILESGWRDNQKGLESSYRNCSGWMHMVTSLKAYLEHGINIRKGAFEGYKLR